jgi:FtsZ-binding cell division protein ZapB
MASYTKHGYQPIAVPDWQELLQSLADSIENFHADHPQQGKIDGKSRSGLIRHYVLDLEYTLEKANKAISYYEDLTHNYERLVSVMEESRNQAYDTIGLLKNEIEIYKKYKPLIYPGTDEEDRNE